MKIMRPPEPDDIKWNFIGYSFYSRRGSIILSLSLSIVLFGLFLVIFLVMYRIRLTIVNNKNRTGFRDFIQRSLSTLGFKLSSFVFLEVVDFFSTKQRFLTISRFLAAKSKQLANANTICILIAIIFGIMQFKKEKLSDNDPQLDQEMWLSFVFNYFLLLPIIEPFLTFFDLKFYWSLYSRKRAVSKLQKDNVLSMTQGEVNELFNRPDSEIEIKYSNLIMIIYILPFISAVMPVACILLLVYVYIQRFVDKVLFIRRYKPPRRDGKSLAYFMFSYSKKLPFVHIVSRILMYGSIMFQPGYGKSYQGLFEIWIHIVMIVLSLIPYKFLHRWLIKTKSNKLFDNQVEEYYSKPTNHRKTDLSVLLNQLEEKREIIFDEISPFLDVDYDRENPRTTIDATREWKI
jgi:hypothetical protein